MKIAMPYIPEEFAIETDTPLAANTEATLHLRATRNPVPTLAVAMEFLAGEGVEVDDDARGKVVRNTVLLAASPLWEELAGDDRRNSMGRRGETRAAHRAFITKLIHNLRNAGHAIPVQSWEPKPESSETKEEN